MIAISFPQFDPVAFWVPIPFVSWHGLPVRWYALSYVAGLLLGWWYLVRLLKIERLWVGAPFNGKQPLTPEQVGDFFVWAALGVILGGRIGFVLFYGLIYNTSEFMENPLLVFEPWNGGMSFHGGLIGVILAILLYSHWAKIDVVQLGDLVAAVTPIGLFFGRLANFINGELWGKPSSLPWAMIFPHAPGGLSGVPRHPSQLYEASLEGILLFTILNVMILRHGALRKPGLIIASFFTGYALFRIIVEAFFRDSDQLIFGGPITMGQLLSVPMWVVAGFFFWYALYRERAQTSKA
jgi:phosphatidylglycerol:prolipoprotein diacylglycerol transferase